MGIENMSPKSGRALKEDNTVVNEAEMLEAIYNALVINKDAGITLSGSYVRLSTEPLPTVADGVQDGNDLLVVDPADKNNNKVYIYRTGAWREI